ncbi:DUF2339 domain-containing protein [Rhodohalobacter sp.]|uniref:DUF2339 domain-containing protein n=1 Tax=Rhodohalobacter sp. TaxID=1974210 RepID=UPI002ACE9ABB|nr:DUF2339 domain-containing protein [Rhodohalobacter sp.]MDZ7756448.1 DUF2339 domain-containing protein [Rhodohalobacter sp.]
MESDHKKHPDRRRIEELEQRVEKLEQILASSEAAERPIRKESPKTGTSEKDSYRTPDPYQEKSKKYKPQIPRILKENWLYWLGVGMLLLGVIFLFRYSVEQGWLIPEIRSTFGLITGGVMLYLGFKSSSGETIRQFLIGGGIGVFYITGFATFQLYDFMSYSVVFGFMVAVTVLSFTISVQQNSAILSLIGILGGLATPFLLYRGDGSLAMLMIYTAIILTGAASIYRFKRWNSLLWSQAIGGGIVLLVACVVNILDVSSPPDLHRALIQAVSVYLAVLVWIFPIRIYINEVKGSIGKPSGSQAHLELLSAICPLALLLFSGLIWETSANELGYAALLFSAALGGYSFLLKQKQFKRLAAVHFVSSAVIFTLGLILLLDGRVLLVVIVLEAMAIRIVISKKQLTSFSWISHLLFVTGWVLLINYLSYPQTGNLALIHFPALSELLVIAITGLLAPIYLDSKNEGFLYRMIAHLGILAWIAKELWMVDHSQIWITVAWGIYSIAVLIVGFRVGNSLVRTVGMATILVVVAKLFFVDLSQTSALLRIPLFMGFGSIFLLIGYYLQKQWSSNGDDSGTENLDIPFDKEKN